ncbi:PREDICTED: AT-hook-containing transcription factor [Lepidothrix coronata]|uniref:AT-hook-containing transcription factor n=1 Tax=Lepidothrix coronata TaxID=321398 RepID=A0A6J0IDA8_9PASS|nr:PREDICTED: AT-hook-containing transcription factor [Lepidothrix coronata]
MASPAPWLHCTQTELTPWEGEDEEEEEEEDDFERRMDEDGVIGLGEGARSPPWGAGEDPEEGSPVEEGRWHPQQDLAEEDEERGSSGGDEGPWGAESDGEPYPELSCEGRWGSGTDGGDTSALSDTSPGPATPSRRPRGWGRSRLPKKAAPTVVPPKPARQSRSLSPRRGTGGKGHRDPSGTGTDGTQYGRGRLNHPLPDLSKVEARVKFDQSYRPPRGRVLPARPRVPGGPVGFKSPAEIVREVLLSSGEGVPSQPPSTTGLPQEFRSPKQATALVQQLQDDYHKLLTKYAEAENTIDQLRLGARVESFERWIRAGSLPPSEQLQRMRLLKDAQDALEREYLRGRQQLPGAAGGFDPDRAVEEEIYRLGLRLEGLKERLEPGDRRQPPLQSPPQPLPQPRCPPAPSPPPAPHSPCPESPELVDGALGTAGDNEGVRGGLPWPLWHKQLRVEEDFADLLEQYKHFKSLPQSLSLEQLSLAGSGSQEEVDAPVAGDGGPGKVPCRTRSLEEGADLETFPVHPPERKAALLPSKGPPKAEGTRGHPSPATSEEPPATAKPHLVAPGPPRAPLSRRSSGTGSTAPQHGPRKVNPLGAPLPAPPDPAGGPGVLSTDPAVPVPLQEQRIVSPETDSGFVGSEASRVSPPVHTPEHRPPGTGTPGSLGPSIPIPTTLRAPRNRETTALPSETALMGIYPAGGQGGTGGLCLPPSTPSQSSSPPRWAESAGSEAGPDPGGDGAHTDSEVGDRSCASTSGHPPAMARRVPPSPAPTSPPPSPETPSPTLLSPDLPSLTPAHCDLLGSRLERDQAIRELREEVWRLRRRLEETLHRSRSYPEGKATPRVAPARRQPVGSAPSSPQDAAPPGELSPPARGRVAPGVAPTRRGRSASLPRDRPELDLTSESDPSPAGPRARPSLRKHPGSPPGAVTFRGQYTGTRYQGGTPRAAPAPREEPGTPGCPRCHRSGTSSGGFWEGDATQQPQHSTPRRTRCPTCRAPLGPPVPGSRDRTTHAERGPGATSSPGSHVGPRAEKPDQPGFWYLAAGPAATVCLAPVPLVPYVPSVLYCSPAVPTSAPATAAATPRLTGGNRRAQRPPRAQPRHRCLSLDLEELDQLNWSLSRAVEAAQSVRVTTTRMSRALAAELGRARDLRSSCLF